MSPSGRCLSWTWRGAQINVEREFIALCFAHVDFVPESDTLAIMAGTKR